MGVPSGEGRQIRYTRPIPPTQSFRQHEGGSLGIRTYPLGLPTGAPVGQSDGVDGKEAHSQRKGEWHAITLIVCEFPPYSPISQTQSFHQHEVGSLDMRTCQIAKPPSTPADQSVRVGGMEAHARIICAWLAITLIV